MTRTLPALLILTLLLGACSILPGSKSNPAPSDTPSRDTLLTAMATVSPTTLPVPSLTSSSTPTSTPMPTLTSTPPPSPLVEVTGPGAYPGDLPYLASITAYLPGGASPVVVEAGCEGTLLRPDAEREQTLHPGQSVAFFFVIPPGHAPDCLVLVDGQECGQWTVALDSTPERGDEEPMTMTCAAESPSKGVEIEGGEP